MLGCLEVVEYSLTERFNIKYLHQVSLSAFARCNWCVPIVLLSIWYNNVCACHSPVCHYIAATVVYLVQCIIAACVVVI